MLFWENFKRLCYLHQTNPTQVCRDLGLVASAATKWKNGSMPNGKTVSMLAKYFNVPPSYFFIEHEDNETEMSDYLEQLRNRPEIRTLFSLTKNASREDVERAVAIIKALKETNNG